jgi:carboxylesterase
MASSAARVDPTLGLLERGHERSVGGAEPPVLAFHGFAGTPFEVELVVQAAESAGLRALAPVLPGHGTRVEDLARTRFSDWSEGARAALDRVGPPAIVAGLSLGSLLALDLALRRPLEVRALVLLANAVWLTAPFPRWALWAAEQLRCPDFLSPKSAPDIRDFDSRQSHVGYNANPVHAAMDVRRAGGRLAARLQEIRCPVLILHGAKDRVCPVANAWRVAERLGSDDCRVVVLPRSAHILTRDLERETVKDELRRFFLRLKEARVSAG